MSRDWKVVDFLERMKSEDPEDMIRDEVVRIAGRLEARGYQKVRVGFDYPDASTLGVRIEGRCPCGEHVSSNGMAIPLDLFSMGPSTLEAMLLQLEHSMKKALDNPATGA